MTQAQRRLAREIFAKAMFISEYTPADGFVDYSPHVDGLEVHIYREGWNLNENNAPDKLLESHKSSEDEMIRALNEMDVYIANAPVDTNKWMEEQ